MSDQWFAEWRAAARGVVPAARRCDDMLDLAFWLICFALAARRPIYSTRTTIVVRQ